ncbi:olfactory receptor 10A7-like [Gopherus flavomarginatus]|uniref:olfactory receptor 10A7-like n=1 Tax=Gopherus flavomarginatus TaxID=286002 RepID=UPI0021CC0BE2|nr:olfactory receptor 10A7-like [Gopherus flavomarginatus]
MNPEQRNQTSITEFILLGFSTLPELQILLFLLFLMIYIATMSGNILIVLLVVADSHLHTPMYFFLGNLSCLETCYTSTILPSMLAGLLSAPINYSCNDPQLMEMLAFTLSLIFLLVPFLLTLMSYICIIVTILRIPSTTGRKKAFSTCSSHLIVVTMYYGTLLIAYMFPTTNRLRDFKKVLSIFYTVLTPLVNPLIYSLRNKEVKEALRKASRKSMFGQC